MPLKQKTNLFLSCFHSFFNKDGFGIKQPTKVDMPLKQKTETFFFLTFILSSTMVDLALNNPQKLIHQ